MGINRNKLRKVYNYGQSGRPKIRQVLDTITNTIQNIDFQKVIRDNDFFLRKAPIYYTGLFQYIEETVTFSEVSSLGIVFPNAFLGVPFLGFETVQTNGSNVGDPNVAWWVTDLTTTGFTANFSAPFAGAITYRGVYSLVPYPVYVERVPDLPGSFGWVSAASFLLDYQSGVTMSWAPLPSLPEHVNYNPVGSSPDTHLDVGQAIWTVTTNSVTNELSIEFSGTLHVVALDTDTGDASPFLPDPDLSVIV